MIYDPSNIFAKIIRGEIPCHRIYEDVDTLAFMDVMPMVDGHCLVVPKTGSRNLLDADPRTLAALMPVVKKVAAAAMAAFDADGVQIRQYNETAAGQTVFHLHFHILPMREGQELKPHKGKIADQTMLAGHAQLIKEKL
jgi:histidine triad (HIT) family protein